MDGEKNKMHAPFGNLKSVYVKTKEQEINDTVSHSAPLEAELAPEKVDEKTGELKSNADWYLVYTYPGEDLRAMRWLARRRFGVFRPMQQRTDKRNDAPVQGWEPVFNGWLFVFVWDIKKLKARLKACPGVMEILCDPVTQEPAPIDAVDDEGVHFIDRLRARAETYKENAPRLYRHSRRIPQANSAAVHIKKTGPRRPHKLERKALDRLKNELKGRGFTAEHPVWALANGLEPHLRIALLQRTLSTAPPVTVAMSGR